MIISIVGKSGAGKSTIINKLKSLNSNIKHLDIDKIGHYVNDLPEVQEQLIKAFGLSIIQNKKVNRKILAAIVFNNPTAMEKLTEITWPSMESLIDEYISINQNSIIVLDWLLLPKTKYLYSSDLRILVEAPIETRMKRVLKRDNISTEKFLEREKASIDFSKYYFDEVINNSNNIEREVNKIYEKSIISR